MNRNKKNKKRRRAAQRTASVRGRKDSNRSERRGLRLSGRPTGDSKEEFVERILMIARECAAYFKEPYKSIDHGDLLYDENGLPK